MDLLQRHLVLAVFVFLTLPACGGRSELLEQLGGKATDPSSATAGGASAASSASIRISPSVVPQGTVNRPYQVTFVARSGTPGYTFTLLDGALPPGLSLDASGRLAGTPSAAGSFMFTVQVRDAEGTSTQVTYQLQVTAHRWFEAALRVGEPVSRLEHVLIDLANPNVSPVVLDENVCGYAPRAFSPNGRWLMYSSCDGRPVGGDQVRVQVYLVSLADATPGRPQLLFESSQSVLCVWAPDSNRLACLRAENGEVTVSPELIAFDTSQSSPGPLKAIATLPPVDPDPHLITRTPDGGRRGSVLAFLDPDSLAVRYGPNDFARVDWHGGQPTASAPLGLGGGEIVAQAPDGRRAEILHTNPNYAGPTVLADLKSAQATVLESTGRDVAISASFEAAYVWSQPATGGDLTFSFYSVTGMQWLKVGERLAPTETLGSLPMSGHTALMVKQGRLVTLTITATDLVEQEVPGDYQTVYQAEFDPTGTWIRFATTPTLDEHRNPTGAIEQWLSRLQTAGPSPAKLVDQGLEGSASFSPNGQWLVLIPYSSPMQYHLLNLSDPEQIRISTLDWQNGRMLPIWSPDSTYFAFLAPYHKTPLYLVDVLAPGPVLKNLGDCSSDTATGLDCSFSPGFQP